MAIKLKTEEGTEFSFDTVAEFMEFKKKMDEEEASKEITSEPVEDTSEDEIEVPDNEPEIEVGDKVRIVSAEDGTETPYHHINIGSVVEVVSKQSHGGVEVVEDVVHQYLLPGHFEKVESLGKDANGEDLYAGDLVTGTEDNEYGYTNSTVDMEVIGRGRSMVDEDANIRVRIIGETGTYGVDSSKFVKLSDNTDEDEPEFHTGDVVKVTESFEDNLGDRAICGAVYDYDESLALGETFVGTVFLGDNVDKLELVCRAQDRLDK